MLTDIIPAAWRKPIYAVYAVVGVVLGAWQIAQSPAPGWLITALTVYGFVGGALGVTAASNVHVAKRREDGAADVGLILLVLTLIGVVLLLFRVHFGG
jgi:hypothetical protein